MLQSEPKNWRELLTQITNDTANVQRIRQTLGVRDITIKRWTNGVSDPRMQNLRGLLSALPEHRDRLLEFFMEEYDDFADFPLGGSFQEIPPQFYLQVFQTCGTVNPALRYWTIANMVISQALSQLDPDNLGLAVTLVKCMKHSERDTIYSLRQGIGQCTPPWPGNLEQRAMFLGAESLAGFCVITCRPHEVQDYHADLDALPGHQFEHEHSAAAHPILYAGRIAGCLLVSSTEPHAFFQPARTRLIADYAHLIALALGPEDFVDPLSIDLRLMPLHSKQKETFSTFRQRIIHARSKFSGLPPEVAEQYVWEKLEDDLLAQQFRKYQNNPQGPCGDA